ncbi:RNA demethylase ALKBH10B-like isoform X2 [Euphorbia lathyris]|uniref:RNA demethylase ALKBH10B-like isoform X2 n=1 Tax=Euphorbia lathyris TaxID=212925 RepID=UPI00331402BA
MPMEAGPASPTDHIAPVGPAVLPIPAQQVLMADSFAKDAVLSWFRGEFAAANAIIDALCTHLVQLSDGARSDYEPVFAAIHRRRLNWIPVLQMQKYHPIADVALELRRVTDRKLDEKQALEIEMENEVAEHEVSFDVNEKVEDQMPECQETHENDGVHDGGEVVEEEDSPDSDITDSGSQEVQPSSEDINICLTHEDCDARPGQIKLAKGFSAKEHVKGHMVNVVKGLKIHEDVFTESELAKLTDFVNELRVAGQNGELEGETYILFNKQVKGNKRELIQLGVPIFGHIKEDAPSNNETSNIKPIPVLLESVIDHLIQWHLIPEYKKPNGCIIHYFDEDEYSQPFQKPPHLEQPISTLLISESTMAYGRTLVSDNDGNYRGPLMLSLKAGSLLVMRGNSADMARHVMCPSPNKRVSITFFRVRPEANQIQSPPTSPMAGAMTLWQPSITNPYAMPNGGLGGYEAMDAMPKWGVLRAPVVMLAPMRPMVLSPKRMPQAQGGTGVFLPWTVGSRKPAKHLPPRAQKRHLLALRSHITDSASDTGITIEGK